MLIHRRYLTIYTCLTPRNILAFVDALMNGEDIAMNAIVASLTRMHAFIMCSGPHTVCRQSANLCGFRANRLRRQGTRVTVWAQVAPGEPHGACTLH